MFLFPVKLPTAWWRLVRSSLTRSSCKQVSSSPCQRMSVRICEFMELVTMMFEWIIKEHKTTNIVESLRYVRQNPTKMFYITISSITSTSGWCGCSRAFRSRYIVGSHDSSKKMLKGGIFTDHQHHQCVFFTFNVKKIFIYLVNYIGMTKENRD